MRNFFKTKTLARVFRWRDTHQWIESKGDGDKVWFCQPGAMITPWFMIVTLKNGKKQSVFIGVDQCDQKTYRRLLVRLKYLSNPTQEVDANSMGSS